MEHGRKVHYPRPRRPAARLAVLEGSPYLINNRPRLIASRLLAAR